MLFNSENFIPPEKTFMTARYPWILKAFALLLICFISACAVFKGERGFSRNGLTVTFRSINHLDDVQNLEFSYPIRLSEKKVRNHLLSLWHQDIVSPKGKPKAVFSLDEAATLTPLFATVFKKVKPGKYLHFKFKSAGGLIEGQVFATAKKIHWHFLKINNRNFSNDPLRIRKPTWKLVRMRGQNYQRLQTGGFKKAIKNRIIADIDLPFPKQRYSSTAKPDNSPKNEEFQLGKNLNTLQKLLDTGLINEEEYQKKKAFLLDQYFEDRS